MSDKVAILVLAGTETYEGMARVVNALIAVKEYRDAGEDVKLIFDGEGTRWVEKFSNPDQSYRELYEEVKDKVSVCAYCAGAFNVAKNVKEQNLPLADEFEGHPSVRSLIKDGYQVIAF